MKTRRTLAIVAPYFPPHTGGLERYAFEMARHLSEDHAWRVIVITSGERYGNDEKTDLQGLTVYRLAYRFKFSNTPLSFGWFHKIRKIVREEEPDIVNVHTPVPGMADIAALCIGKRPLIVTYHALSMRKGTFLPDILIYLYEHLLLPLLLHRANHVICSSDSVRTDFLAGYRHKSTTITPAVNTDMFTPDIGENKQGSSILFVASELSHACDYKGLSLLIETIDVLNKKGEHVSLAVVGDGDMRAEYEESVGRRGLKDNVSFLGRLNGDALAGAYRQAQFFVLPSSNDNSPMVILEAMASGLPVISTTVGDIPKLVDDGRTGYLIAPHDIGALVQKIEELLHDEKKTQTFGAAGREKMLKEFSWSQRANSYNKVLTVVGKQSRNIVHISAYYPPHVGGVERIVQRAAEKLAERGQPTVVITSSGKLTSRVTTRKNITVREIASFEFAHTPFAPGLLVSLLRLPRESIMHLHLAQAYWPECVRLASFIRRIPYIVHFHLDVGPSGHFGELFLLYKRLTWGPLLRRAKRVIVCSPLQVAIVRDTYGVSSSHIEVIPNAVGESFFAKRIYVPSQDILRLLYIGRLAPQKRIERLIEACARLSIPAHLTIVGGGEGREALEVLVRERRLKNVSFVGAKDDTQMQQHQRESDVFLIASDIEGAPLVVLEAMAAGLPIIATDVLGLREMVGDVGLLVTEPYPQRFVEAIEALWKRPARLRELSGASRAKAEKYRWPTFMEQLEAVYKKIDSH